jgi:hypothetical protein
MFELILPSMELYAMVVTSLNSMDHDHHCYYHYTVINLLILDIYESET